MMNDGTAPEEAPLEVIDSTPREAVLPVVSAREQFEGRVADYVERVGVPPFAFDPQDSWAVTFRKGLEKISLPEEAVAIEVGVGLGVNAAWMLERHESAQIYGTDFQPKVIPISALTVQDLLHQEDVGRYKAVPGSNDLLSVWLEGGAYHGDKAHVIFGCIPQVRLPEALRASNLLAEGEAAAHYYDPSISGVIDEHFKELLELFDHFDLGLNARLLSQARSVLHDDGKVVLNLAGRVPRGVLDSMFEHFGFRAEVVHRELIPQHPGTSLEAMAQDEATLTLSRQVQQLSNGTHEFVFYDNPEGEGSPLSAREAYGRQLQKNPVYHELFVMEGRRVEN